MSDIEQIEVTRHPIDVESLEIGSTISVAEVEQITGSQFGTDAFRFGLMGLVCAIRYDLWNMGRRWKLVTHKGAIRILYDREVARHVKQDRRSALRSMARRQVELTGVDVNVLVPVERQELDREVFVHGKIMQGIAAARKQIRSEAHKRKTPGLPKE